MNGENVGVTVGIAAIALLVPEIHCTSGLLAAIFELPSSIEGKHCRHYHPSIAHERKCTGRGGIQLSDGCLRQSASFHDFSAILAAILDS